MSTLPVGAHTGLQALILGLFLSAPVAPLNPLQAQWSTGQFSSMEARNIGPAGMSGRVTVVDVDPSDKTRIFVGAAAGGVWRSEDGGITWHTTFDDQPVQSIGHLAVSRANPDLVWAGTGEGNPRQSVSIGRGVFRSMDGGDTWTHVGLEASEHISRVIAHPTNADIAYVGAMGPLWSDGEERGLYRTTDRGESWQRVLYVDAQTGVADMIMDPSNPDKLFVAMYDHRRSPWNFESGGAGGGLYVTRDGGDSWTKLGPENGVPSGPLGRIGLAISASSPDVVYALVEAEQNALLRSDDGGKSWRTASNDAGINPRPMYFADIRVDPKNENRIYRLAGSTDVSDDAGRTWRTTVPSNRIHGDVHELWIDPDDPRRMIMGNDGGLGITYDRGVRWRFVENLPLSQFYQVSVDMAVPFNVYGGVQDSGGWMGPSNVWDARGIVQRTLAPHLLLRRIPGHERLLGLPLRVLPDPERRPEAFRQSDHGASSDSTARSGWREPSVQLEHGPFRRRPRLDRHLLREPVRAPEPGPGDELANHLAGPHEPGPGQVRSATRRHAHRHRV